VTVASLASATSGWMVPAPLCDSGNCTAMRDTVMTVAPASAKAVVIPRPRPRDAPTTIVVLLDMSFMVVMAVSPLRGFAVGFDEGPLAAASAGCGCISDVLSVVL
jgi:hypothetical protein